MISITDKSKCCGCAACAQKCPKQCISMEYDAEGCEYPVVNVDQCIDCGLCEKACPVLNVDKDEPKSQRAFLVQHNNQKVLAESTSGGAFTALAQAVIANGGIVFGAGYLRGEQLVRAEGAPGRLKVGHFSVESVDELWRFRNSKYVQSVVGPAYPEVKQQLKTGREVLFIGTPCQCEGLLRFLGGKPANLRVADFVCRANPARAVFARQVEWLDAKVGVKGETVLFRDKSRFGYRYSNMCELEGETLYGERLYSEGVETDPYLRAFFADLSDRPICYECPFKKRYRVTDLTCWDFFDVYRLSKEFDDNRGVTRVLIQSDEGQELLDRASSYARMKEIDVEAAVEGVRELTKSVKLNPRRDEFMADVANLDGEELMNKWFPDSGKVKAERFARHTCEKLGIYDPMKRLVKKIIKK